METYCRIQVACFFQRSGERKLHIRLSFTSSELDEIKYSQSLKAIK